MGDGEYGERSRVDPISGWWMIMIIIHPDYNILQLAV